MCIYGGCGDRVVPLMFFCAKTFLITWFLTQTLFGSAWFSQHSDTEMPQMHFVYVLKVIWEEDTFWNLFKWSKPDNNEELAPGIPHQPDKDIFLILKPMICSQNVLAPIHFQFSVSTLSLSNKDQMTSSSRFTFWKLDEEQAWSADVRHQHFRLSGCGNIHTS